MAMSVSGKAPHPDNPAFFSTQVVEARRFYLDLSPPADSDLAVVSAGYEQCSPEYRIQRESFPYFSLELVSHGSGELVMQGQTAKLFRGVAYSYGPGIPHVITTDRQDPAGKYFVDFVGKRSAELLAACQLSPGSVVNVVSLGKVQSVLELMLQDGSEGAANSSELCRILLEYLLQRIKVTKRMSGTSQSQAESTYERCRNFIFENSTRIMTLEAVSKECNIDKAYLCRLFQRFDHQTPYQYLIKQKMDKAATLLKNPELLVSEVAYALGYTDPFLFSRAFKSVFRVSPTEFRRIRA